MKKVLFILMAFFSVLSWSEAQRMIRGSVTSKDGSAILGANVVVKGTTIGTVTEMNGTYSINVPSGSNTLVISYTGYNTQEIVIGATNVVDVTLTEGILLQETVVTALGIRKEEKSLGYSISKVGGNQLVSSGEINPIQGLAAKSANLNITSSAGTPGASSKILLRGVGSFQLNSQPLIIVDNIPYDNSTNTVQGGDYPFNANLQGVSESNRGYDLNSSDIESISVLKGPSASLLYGSRAANGVILVTTKKGSEGNIKVDYGFSYSFDKVNKLPEFQNTYGQGSGGGGINADGTAKAEGTFNTYNPAAGTNGTPNSWGPKIGSASTPTSYDNLDNFFQLGHTSNHNIAFSGGNDKANFRFSYGRTDQDGFIPNTELKRNTFRLNAGAGAKKFKVEFNGSYSTSTDIKAQQGSNLSGIMLPLFRTPVSFNNLGGTGSDGFTELDGSQHRYIGNYDNPLWTAYHNTNKGDVGRINSNVSFNYEANSWLNLTYRIGTDMYNDARQQIFDIGNHNNDPTGEIWESNYKFVELNQDLFARFNRSLTSDIGASLVLGTQLNDRKTTNIFARGRNFSIPNLFNLSNTSDRYFDNAISRRKLAGLFGSLDLSYKNYLYLNLAARNDWASTFGPKSDGSYLYPSASLAFVASELFASTAVPYLKLRTSFASVGREPDPYLSATYFDQPVLTDGYTDGLSFPYTGVNGFGYSYKSVLGNNAIKPEKNQTIEFGVDAHIYKILTLGLTYYISKASDLLLLRPIANSTGFKTIFSNAGKMENKGIEVELGINVLKRPNFSWDINLNFAKNTNEVTELANGVDQISLESAFTGIGSYAIVGQPIGAFFGSKWKRDAGGQLIIGANGLPLKEALEGNLGNPYPDWLGGINNSFSIYGFTLSGLIDIRQGQSIWGGTIGRLNRIGRLAATADRNRTYIIDGVKADGTKNDKAISANSYYSGYLGDGGGAQEQLVFDGSWVRLREVTLSYSFKKVGNLRVFGTGRNLWLNTKYPGVDPETSLTGAGSLIGGFDYFNNPSTKSFIVGFNIGF